ncbi:MAG TPA: phosphoribosyltransferase family protein [Bryobacteraceae bacterium]|jgi:orotate phosphoribosyltransferase|nr:phosphoribosyltransferase family protein [Bryobacteraceae bacterium]
MHLTPTQDEVVALLRDTGALRDGHFEAPDGLHSNEYLQLPLALRHYQIHKTLSVGLARLLRANPEIRAITPELSIVTPIVGGLPVAFGVCEALRAKRVYWAERDNANESLRFRQFLSPEKGEQVVIVDDILRTGRKLSELKALLESNGAEIVGLAVVIYQPFPNCATFGNLPLYYLAKLEARYAVNSSDCEWCKSDVPLIKTWI